MCKSPLHPLLTALPKCEHHMHLEGSLSPELLFELAAKNAVALPQDDPAFASVEALYARYDRFTSLDDFLHYYYIGFTVLQHQSDFEALAYAYLARAHRHAVRHAEVFFDPQVHLDRGIALSALVDGFAAAQRRARAEFGITSLLIPCLLRHLPVEHGEAVFRQMLEGGHFATTVPKTTTPASSAGSAGSSSASLVSDSSTSSAAAGAAPDSGSDSDDVDVDVDDEAWATPGKLAALGLCSTEKARPPEDWKPIFAAAAAAGVRRTVHAGEEGPASYVSGALDALGAQRIDHGVRSAEDPAVVARLARERVLLSVCPLSNVALRAARSVAEVPIRDFLAAGVRFSINSDDPAYFGGYIQENYCAVQEAHDLSVAEWETVARHAVEGSWCGRARKEVILAEIDAVVSDWRARGEVAVTA